jgi:hypothetical protein
MLFEERRKLSALVKAPETQGETPWSCAGMLSVWGPPLSKLAELPSVYVWTLEVFGQRPFAWGRTLHSFRRMPCAFGGEPLPAPTAAVRVCSDAIE